MKAPTTAKNLARILLAAALTFGGELFLLAEADTSRTDLEVPPGWQQIKAAPKPTPKPSPTPKATPLPVQAPPKVKATPRPKATPKATPPQNARQWRHLPLVVSEAKDHHHYSRTAYFGMTKPMGMRLREGDLLVGSMRVISIKPHLGPDRKRYCRIEWLHASGQKFFTLAPMKVMGEMCVGATETARSWCPLKVVALGNPAGVILPSGCTDSEGMR
jgi:hypothetical protein